MPWRMAQSTEWLTLNEIAIASAVPNVMPVFTTSRRTCTTSMVSSFALVSDDDRAAENEPFQPQDFRRIGLRAARVVHESAEKHLLAADHGPVLRHLDLELPSDHRGVRVTPVRPQLGLRQVERQVAGDRGRLRLLERRRSAD